MSNDKEEKWGTAEGIITGEAPRRGSSIRPPPGSWSEAGAVAREQMGRAPRPAVIPEVEWAKQAGKDIGEFLITPPRIRRERAALSPTVTQDLSREVTDRVLDRTADYATRVEGRIQPQREPQPVVAPRPDLERIWGIGQETLPTGGTRYTVPGEGVMTVGPETRSPATAAFDEEYARTGVMQAARGEEAARERGIIYREDVERARRTQAETDARIEEEKLQEAAGIIPRRGMAEYEYNAARMRMTPAERKAQDGATGEAKKTYIAGRASREAAGIQAEGVVSAAGMKAQTEAARLGIQAADVKSKMQLRQSQMDQMLTESGLIGPMKLKLQGAKDDVERKKIQRDFYDAASKDIFDKKSKALAAQHGIGQIDLPTYNAELDKLVKSRVTQQGIISNTYAPEGTVHSDGDKVMRNGIWVDIPGKGKKE